MMWVCGELKGCFDCGVAALASGVRSGQIPLIIPQKGQLTGQLTGQLLHQIVNQRPQIIGTSQPAIISVTQGQTLAPMVAKVSLTTVPHTAPIQTLSAAAGSPITVTQVSFATQVDAWHTGTRSHMGEHWPCRTLSSR